MGAKDRKANEYFADNRRFADMCNAVLFGGRTVILPEALEATDTTELLSVLGMDGKEISFQKWRDLLKRVIIKKNQNVYLVLIGAELQSDIQTLHGLFERWVQETPHAPALYAEDKECKNI